MTTTSTTKNAFPLLTAAALRDPATAITANLEPFQVAEFMEEYRAGLNLQSWIDHVAAVRQDVAENFG